MFSTYKISVSVALSFRFVQIVLATEPLSELFARDLKQGHGCKLIYVHIWILKDMEKIELCKGKGYRKTNFVSIIRWILRWYR